MTRQLRKADFLARVNLWASKRYDVEYTVAKFESWIDEGLVPAWQFDCYAYRLTLEACRIENRAPEGRRLLAREIRVEMYLSGRRFPETVIVDDMREAFARSRRELFRDLRNAISSIDSEKLGTKRVSNLARHMGEVDSRIVPPGFQYRDSELVSLTSFFQTGEHGPKELGPETITPIQAAGAIIERWGFAPLINAVGSEFPKLMIAAFAGVLGDPDEIGDDAGESALATATNAPRDPARQILSLAPSLIRQIPLIAAAIWPEKREQFLTWLGPCETISKTINTQRFRLALYVMFLTGIQRNSKKSFVPEVIPWDLLSVIRQLMDQIQGDSVLGHQLNSGNPWEFVGLLVRNTGEMTATRIRLIRLILRFRSEIGGGIWPKRIRRRS